MTTSPRPTRFPIFCSMLICLLLPLPVSAQWLGIDDKVGSGVKRLESSDADGNHGLCSAARFNSARDYVVTAGHCVPTKAEGRSLAVDGRHADLVVANAVIDLAILKVVGLDGRELPIRDEKLRVGLPLAVVGYAFGAKRAKYTFGFLSDDEEDTSVVPGFLSDATAIGGDSGGVVVDQEGRIVGVVQAGVSTGPGGMRLTVSSTTRAMRDFLKPYLPEKSAEKPAK